MWCVAVGGGGGFLNLHNLCGCGDMQVWSDVWGVQFSVVSDVIGNLSCKGR